MYIPYSKLANTSRVWIYQADRIFSEKEEVLISQKLLDFCNNWKAHQNHLKSSFKIVENCFLILLVDEQHHITSGCAIDSSVKTIKEIEKEFKLSFFDRTLIAYENEKNVKLVPIKEFKKTVSQTTVVFNNLVTNKLEFEKEWRTTAVNSWHKKYLV